MAIDIGRRQFIFALGQAAVSWPLAASAQQPMEMRRLGILMNFAADDPEGQARLTAFVQELQKLGWTEGRNVHVVSRWAGAGDRYRPYAAELVALSPDVILAGASPSVAALQEVTRSMPIVFASVVDPVGGGFVASLARPRGNATGFIAFEYSLGGKWLELLREIAPNVTRVAVLRDAAVASGIGQFAAIQTAAPSSAVELSAIDTREVGEIERGVVAFAGEHNGGLIMTLGPAGVAHRDLIISLAKRFRLPSVFAHRYYAESGGLASYGPDPIDEYRRAAAYVDRILKGEKPADLPVQAPTRYELVVNLKTAKAIALNIPQTVLSRADKVIE
jgi:putative ABC transport system substrate-binding protein